MCILQHWLLLLFLWRLLLEGGGSCSFIVLDVMCVTVGFAAGVIDESGGDTI